MNIVQSDNCDIIAKTCRQEKGYKKVAYYFVDNYHNLCKDKKDVILAEINACERLLEYNATLDDVMLIEEEISELRMALDLVC